MRENGRRFSLGHFTLAALLALSIAAAALLSAAPLWHEYLHPDQPSSHLCLVTLFGGGQCEAASAAPVSAVPAAALVHASLPLPVYVPPPSEHFFSLLEHAPPLPA